MADLGSALVFEVDASNQSTVPDGWPEGQNPSTVNNCARANMGADKRFWVRSNSVFTTAGTATAYTLTYAQAETAYYDGEEFSLIINATCGAAPSLNINGLGARNLRKFVVGLFMTLVAGDLVANQQVRVRYNLAATTFDIISNGPQSWSQSVGVVATVDFTLIPATVNDLKINFKIAPATNAANLVMQLYDSGGSLDTGLHYAYMNKFVSSTATEAITGTSGAAAMIMSGTISSSGFIAGTIDISDIQRATTTHVNWTNTYLDSGGALYLATSGGGVRAVAGPITGFRLFFNSGNVNTGRVTLRAPT